MKNFAKKILLPALFAAVFQQNVQAQSKTAPALEKAVESLRLALISGDKNELERITAEGLTYGHSNGRVENREQFITALTSGSSDFTDITLSAQTLTISGKTAIVRHSLSGVTNDAGKAPGTVKLEVMLVFVREKKAWKLLARQAVRNQS